VPIHENVIRHYVNVELYDSGDVNKEDCLGWITIMEKCEGNLRDKLKRDKLDLEERKKIARGIQSGIKYLEKVGIKHKDRKLANYLLIGDVVRICDFGLVTEYSGRKSYRNLGYTRKGKKHRKEFALCKFMSSNNFKYFYFSCWNAGICRKMATWWRRKS